MNPNINFSDSTTLRILYVKYKGYILPLIFLILALLILFNFSLPNFYNYQNEKSDFLNAQNTLNILKQNLNIITNLKTSDLNSYSTTVVRALPQSKNFEEILNSISDAESNSGVTLGDYSFQPGNLEKNLSTQNYISISLTVLGDISKTERFLRALKSELPLNNVLQISVASQNSSTIDVIFYYDPTTQVAFDPLNQIQELSNSDLKTLRNLSVFNTNFLNSQSSTSSASL